MTVIWEGEENSVALGFPGCTDSMGVEQQDDPDPESYIVGPQSTE